MNYAVGDRVRYVPGAYDDIPAGCLGTVIWIDETCCYPLKVAWGDDGWPRLMLLDEVGDE